MPCSYTSETRTPFKVMKALTNVRKIFFFIQGEKRSSEKLNDLQNQWQKNQSLQIAAPYKMLGETKNAVSRLITYEK